MAEPVGEQPLTLAAESGSQLRIAREPALAQSLRDAGEERSKLYDYRRMAQDYVNVYREVTGA